MRKFNTAGPVRPARDYCVPPLERLDLGEVLGLIRDEAWFVLHAPRQTGKTSALLALRDLLNGGSEGALRCVYVNVEIAQAAREEVGLALRAIIGLLAEQARAIPAIGPVPPADGSADPRRNPYGALLTFLARWAAADPRPLVLLIDEVDALVGDTLVSVLRQLRSGYSDRPERFPASVILCGVRDVRDYRFREDSAKEVIAGGSAFNIKADSLRLGDFTRTEVEALLDQHAVETGQSLERAALDALWEQTRGQPWLVNALARQLCFRGTQLIARDQPISERDVFDAREALILRRDTHIDQLAAKLREPRVRRVIEPLLSGEAGRYSELDFRYVRDLGLVGPGPSLRVANPIYSEVLPRELTSVLQHEMAEPRTAWHVDADGGLDMDRLLAAFQGFFRRNSEHWVERARYTEAGPQLVLQAFLHRVINGRGRVSREYALGSRRVDLLISWPDGAGNEQRFVVECKLVRQGRSHGRAVATGLEQTADYMDLCGADAGHLVVFDMREGRTWSEKIFREERRWEDARIILWGA